MSDTFEIPVHYKGKELSFPASLISIAYNYKIQVYVFGKTISYESYEERNFRALINQADFYYKYKIDKALIKEIDETLQIIFKD